MILLCEIPRTEDTGGAGRFNIHERAGAGKAAGARAARRRGWLAA